MNDDLNINSSDELKAALDSALRNGAVLPESADYLMERFDVLCVDIDNVFSPYLSMTSRRNIRI